MADLPTANQITDLAKLLAPGLVVLGIRDRFKEGLSANLKDKIIAYGVMSVFYYAAIGPAFHAISGWNLSPWAWDTLHYFIVPAILGGLIVSIDQSDCSIKYARSST